MVKKLPCLYGYIGETQEGDRNTNLFKAINHLTYYNKTSKFDEIVQEALSDVTFWLALPVTLIV